MLAHLIAILRLAVRCDDLTSIGHFEAAIIGYTRGRRACEVIGLVHFQHVNYYFFPLAVYKMKRRGGMEGKVEGLKKVSIQS